MREAAAKPPSNKATTKRGSPGIAGTDLFHDWRDAFCRVCVGERRSEGLAAFTLIELLVVIAVIGILAGLALPVIQKAQSKGRQTYCMNNLHQFATGLASYRRDHDERFPAWLSNLYPYYVDGKAVYVCRSDGSKGRDGSKPIAPEVAKDASEDFKETDDTCLNTQGAATNRNTSIEWCSYMFEFCGAKCDWWSGDGYILPEGADSEKKLDRDHDGVISWCEVKIHQMEHGDNTDVSKFQPYTPSFFPMIRCFHHWNERKALSHERVNNVRTGKVVKKPITLNASYIGNIFEAPVMWEDRVGVGR